MPGNTSSKGPWRGSCFSQPLPAPPASPLAARGAEGPLSSGTLLKAARLQQQMMINHRLCPHWEGCTMIINPRQVLCFPWRVNDGTPSCQVNQGWAVTSSTGKGSSLELLLLCQTCKREKHRLNRQTGRKNRSVLISTESR